MHSVHIQLHCTSALCGGRETFQLTVEQRAVLATVGFGKPHLPACLCQMKPWPWQGGGAPITISLPQLVVCTTSTTMLACGGSKTAQCACSAFYRLPFGGFYQDATSSTTYSMKITLSLHAQHLHAVSRSHYQSAMNGKQCVVTLAASMAVCVCF